MPDAQIERRVITLADAERLIRSRADLYADGVPDRLLRRRVEEGRLIRVRRGWYVPTSTWARLWPEGRHLLQVVAASRDAKTPPILCGASAAVVHGFPLYRHVPQRVHICVPTPAHVASTPGVLRHELPLEEADIVELGGLRVTSEARTVLDVSRMLAEDTAQPIADAALRRAAVVAQQQTVERASAWRQDMRDRIAGVAGAPGSRRASRVIEFADGRAQLPGESVSRLRLRRLGFREVQLQVPVPAPGGGVYYADFALDEIDAYGEFDGTGKYFDPELRRAVTAEAAFLDEKWREDWLRGVTGRRVLRWGSAHIRTARSFAERLAAFGVPFTGDLRLDRRMLR